MKTHRAMVPHVDKNASHPNVTGKETEQISDHFRTLS
jgi:hypothetical protein